MTIAEITNDNIDISEIEKACNLPSWGRRKLTLATFEGEIPVAFVSADYVLDECTIFSIGCLPEYRRKGLACTLLSTLIAKTKSREFAFITLEVRSLNKPAIALYEKSGFLLQGCRKNYYKNPNDDALIYTLNLR